MPKHDHISTYYIWDSWEMAKECDPSWKAIDMPSFIYLEYVFEVILGYILYKLGYVTCNNVIGLSNTHYIQ